MKTLKINKNSVEVINKNGIIFLVAKYEDDGGVYFLNELLEKQYAIIEKSKVENINEEFNFNVEYEDRKRLRGWSQKNVMIKAKNYESAINKINKRFKKIYEISEI